MKAMELLPRILYKLHWRLREVLQSFGLHKRWHVVTAGCLYTQTHRNTHIHTFLSAFILDLMLKLIPTLSHCNQILHLRHCDSKMQGHELWMSHDIMINVIKVKNGTSDNFLTNFFQLSTLLRNKQLDHRPRLCGTITVKYLSDVKC